MDMRVVVPVKYRIEPFKAGEVFLVECPRCFAMVMEERLAGHINSHPSYEHTE